MITDRLILLQSAALRFLRLKIPMSSQCTLSCARSTLLLVGALRHCIALLLALRRSVLHALIAKWHQTEILVFFPQSPSKRVARPASETLYQDLTQLSRATLIIRTSKKPNAPPSNPCPPSAMQSPCSKPLTASHCLILGGDPSVVFCLRAFAER